MSGRVSIGSIVDLPAILNRHRAQLGMNAHSSRALQRDWNELGAHAFAFEVLDTLAPPDDPGHDSAGDLRELERLWGREDLAGFSRPGPVSPILGVGAADLFLVDHVC